tara:strand:+ start:1892 stop:3106 length:1215 start_codon:yes stop_codon:yes gene_type:complete
MNSDFYLEFENKFRGNRQNIIHKLSIYDSLIDLFISNNTEISLLDIGCGRGEWLQKLSKKIPNSMGIEQDQNMINLCQKLGLNIIKGEAIEILSSLESDSISLITIFHMIEHIESQKLTLLLEQCYRVLKDDGMLIMETPSIDNLLVSSKLFYIDSTHINHINPERIVFDIEFAGFVKAKYYYINGGPLENSSSLKLTRILNGVAQDLSIIACKSNAISDYIFNINLDWEANLSKSSSTLDAATSFDYELERSLTDQSRLIHDQNKLINILNKEIILFKEKLSILETNQLTLNKIFSPLIKILRYLKKITIYVCTATFSFMANYRITRCILNYKYVLLFIRISLKLFPFNLLNLSYEKVYEAINKVKQIDIKSMHFNQKLTTHYNNSKSAQEMRNIIIKRIFRK